MKKEDNSQFISELRNIVDSIVSFDFEPLRKNGQLGRLSEADILNRIKSYPGKITSPPESAFTEFNLYPIDSTLKNEWFIDFDLWFDNEKSDLTLSLYAKKMNHSIHIEINDLHTL